MTPDHRAFVSIPDQGQLRPAAFVFRTGAGIAWLEPAYILAQPVVRPAFHRFDGDVTQGETTTTVVGAQGTATVMTATPENDDPDGSCLAAIMEFEDALVQNDKTLAEERARVMEVLGDQLS